MHSSLIVFETQKFAELRRRLLDLDPDLDDQTLADTLEGATNLREVLGALIRSALDDECLADALRARLDAMRSRLERLETRVATKRQLALESMEAADLRKLTESDFTAALRSSPRGVQIIDQTLIPAQFMVPQPAKLDRRTLLGALTKGEQVPGACLSEPRTLLSIRSQ